MDTDSISELQVEGFDIREFRMIRHLLDKHCTVPPNLIFAPELEEEKKDIIFKIDQILNATEND